MIITDTYNLFLDDCRIPSDAFLYTQDTDFLKLKWIVVQNYNEFVHYISQEYETGKFPSMISFDHDLADVHYNEPISDYSDMEEKTGYHCAQWLANFCMDNDIKLPAYKVHSMNPVGKKNIESYLTNYLKCQNM